MRGKNRKNIKRKKGKTSLSLFLPPHFLPPGSHLARDLGAMTVPVCVKDEKEKTGET